MSKLFRTITNACTAPANQSAAAPATQDYTRIFIRDMRVDMLVGIYDHEKAATQPVVINIECDCAPSASDWRTDNYDQVVCYETIANAVKQIASSGHINLVETFAAHIADFCMQDTRVQSVTVRIEKVAVFDFAQSAGVEIRRTR